MSIGFNKNHDTKAVSPRSKRTLFTALGTVIMIAVTSWLFPSSSQISLDSKFLAKLDTNAMIENGISSMASISLNDIYELPEAFVLPVSCDPAPAPNQDCYTVELNSDGKHVDAGSYTDSTISVNVWKEHRDGTVYNFAEVKINHASQFRTMFATGDYSTATEFVTPLNIAKQANAVVAINSDFCRYNQNGSVIIRGGRLYKQSPNGWEVLLVDSDGNFNFTDDDAELVANGNTVEWNGKVIHNSFSFGPVLVRDGQVITDYTNAVAAIHGIYLTGKNTVARAAIGQIGELHYLLCTIDGTRRENMGATVPQIAKAMAEKGCINAYNLDGGHSATLVFDNKLVNVPASKDNTGTQRAQSDIIYFATAIPENN